VKDERIAVRGQKRGRSAAARVEEAQAAFASNYQAYQYRFVEFFIEHLSDLSRSFRGDLQAMIVLALVGQVHLRAVRAAIGAGRDPRDLPIERLGITASRIADVTSIPRETVRRKLDGLEGRGWVLRNQDGSWRMVHEYGVTAARTDLADLDARGIERVARLFRDLEALVAAHAPLPEGDSSPQVGAQSGQVPPSR
jgi:DNA-binding transcriptional ArsR family regulator